MKLLLYALCLLNIALAAVGWYLHSYPYDAGRAATDQAPRLELLSELQAGSVRPRGGATGPVQAEELDSRHYRCELVGPFESRPEAEARVETLSSVAGLSIDGVFERPAIDYWVMIEPRPSLADAEALAEKLAARRLDTYVLTQGDYINGISLGLFRQRDRAEALLQQVRDEGFEPVLLDVERGRIAYWLRLLWVSQADPAALKIGSLNGSGNPLRREAADCFAR